MYIKEGFLFSHTLRYCRRVPDKDWTTASERLGNQRGPPTNKRLEWHTNDNWERSAGFTAGRDHDLKKKANRDWSTLEKVRTQRTPLLWWAGVWHVTLTAPVLHTWCWTASRYCLVAITSCCSLSVRSTRCCGLGCV